METIHKTSLIIIKKIFKFGRIVTTASIYWAYIHKNIHTLIYNRDKDKFINTSSTINCSAEKNLP